MPNSMKGETEVRLADGRRLTLSFTANTWVEIEDEFERIGKPMTTPEIIDELQGGRASMKMQRLIIWCGLRKHQPSMTVEEAGEVLAEAAEAMAAALGDSVPQAEPEATVAESEFEGGDDEGEAGAGPVSDPIPGRGTAS